MNQEDVFSRLIAASEDLTDRGMMNLQKLLEALRVRARAYRQAGEPQRRIREIGGLIRDLPEAAIPPELRKVLEGAIEHYAGGAKGDLPYTEAPDIFVCRNCGHAAVAAAPKACPECGMAAGVFRRFQGMFNGDNAEPEEPSALIDLLEDNARQLEEMVADLEEADCAFRPASGGWCIREHVTHFLDAQAVLIGRVSLILSQDTPPLNTAVPYETATDATGRPAETRDVLRVYLADRKALAARLRSLALADLWRRGRHEDFGLISLMHQVKYFAQHEQAHMGAVAALRSAVRRS
jgi:ribosomal protein L37E